MADIPISIARPVRRRRYGLFALLGLAIVLAALAATLLARTLSYRHETMPGVRIFGTDVGGESRSALERRIQEIVGARLARPVTLLLGKRTLTVRPHRLLAVAMPATATAAMRAGQGSFAARAATLLSPVTPTREVAPVLRIRRKAAGAFLEDLTRFGRPARDATVVVDELRPAVRPARAGTRPEGNRLLAAIEQQVLAGGRVVRVRFRPTAPKIGTLAAKVAAAEASALLAAPVVLRYRGEQVGTLERERLAALLRFRPEGTGYAISFDRNELAQTLEPMVSRWEQEPVDAGFSVEGDVVRVVASKNGAKLDPNAALAAVAAAARRTAERSAPLVLRTERPALTTQGAQALGIRRKLTSFTTEMGPSSSNRIHNVHLMADYIDGTVVRPGATFSFNEVVGPRTTARGFLEGQMIIGSLLVPAVGGGVCQTATTLFNGAFDLGLPVLERHNHGWYISHYPLGRDATVSWGGPDLVFRNDLAHALLIKSSYTDSTLTFTFYGTPQGRRVAAETGPKTHWRRPATSYALDPAAPRGSVRTVSGSNELGFDVTVFRTVYENGGVIRKDSFASNYVAVGPTVIYGPGRPIPGPYFVLPTT